MVCVVHMVWSLASLQEWSIMFGEADWWLATSIVLALLNDVALIFASLDSMRIQNHVRAIEILELSWFELHALAIWVKVSSQIGLVLVVMDH